MTTTPVGFPNHKQSRSTKTAKQPKNIETGIVIGLSTSVFNSYNYFSLDVAQHNKLRKVLLSNGLLNDGHTEDSSRGGGVVLPYIGYIGMCRCEGYGFQAVYFRIGYINQSLWV